MPNDRGFTGQRNERGFGLMDCNARYYSTLTMMFVSPDTIIPDPYSPLDWNRYLYARGNPVKYTDSSGHCVDGLTTILCAAAGGAVIGGAVNAFIQYKATGSVDMQEVFNAAAAGAVSGAVIAVAAPATLIGAVVAGGVANVAGGQASAAYDALVEPSGGGFWQDFAAEGGLYNGSGVEVTNLDDTALDFAIGGLTSGVVKSGTSIGNQVLSKASKVFSFIDDPLVQPRTVPTVVDYQYDMRVEQVVPKIVPAYQTLDTVSRGSTGGLAAGITDKAKEIGSEYMNQILGRIIKPAITN